jgi:hypothetical protein
MDDRKIECREILMMMFKHLALRHSTTSTTTTIIIIILQRLYKHYWSNNRRDISPLVHEYLAMQKLQCKSCTHLNKNPNNHLYTSHRRKIQNKKKIPLQKCEKNTKQEENSITKMREK